MSWEAWVALITVLVTLYALARELAGPDVVLMGALTWFMTLSALSDRFPSPAQAAATFGNEGLLIVGVLFVVAAGLSGTGGLSRVTDILLGNPRSVLSAQARLMVPVAAVSAVMNNTPVVAMFMPLVSDLAKRTGISPSKLFIPLSYAAILGGLCTVIGTSTNLVVQGMLVEARRADPQLPIFGFFTLGAVGLPAALIGLAYLLTVSGRLLPDRRSSRTVLGDPREYTIEMLVEPGSLVAGRTIEGAGLRHLPGLYLASVERNGETMIAVSPSQTLLARDRLIFIGIVDSIVDLQKIRGLVPATDQLHELLAPRHMRSLVEAVVSAASPLVGLSIRDTRFRTRYGAVVIAVHRAGERIEGKIGDIVLRSGDTLLLEAHPTFVETHRHSWDFFLVSPVANSRPVNHAKGWIALGILGAFVVVAAMEGFTGVSLLNAALLAAAAMGITGCITAGDARRSIDWPTLITIGAALGVGRTVQSTGLADALAGALMPWFGQLGDRGTLAGVYALTLIFTEVVTNNAAAALTFPVAYAIASAGGMHMMPFAVVIAMAASAGFASPLGYQTHMMVYGPGGYRFGDYWRIGLPLDLLVMVIVVILTPVFFPLR